eukprot:scaffold41696_cov50-Phaeocystis_antarctica.AAC.2
MGCAGSKDDTAATESKKESKDTAKPEDVEPELSAKVTNAAGRRVSKTVRRVAVRCANALRPPSRALGLPWRVREGHCQRDA